MILRNGSFSELAYEINRHKYKIIIFGSGMIGTITAPQILKQYGVYGSLDFYLDNDKNKCGTYEPISQKRIFLPQHLTDIDCSKYIMLIAVSRFYDVIKQLETLECTRCMPCCIIPMMCITNFSHSDIDCTVKESTEPLIPRVIHYIWFGDSEISEELQYCMNSWKKFCADYEIVRWDESNYDVNKNIYMKQAYENGNYGFAADFARLDIIYRYGGIYLDTDVELKKSLDDMLYQNAFCGTEKWLTVNTGGGIGAVKGSKAVGELLRGRKDNTFIGENGRINNNTCGYYDTLTLMKYGYLPDGCIQKILDMNIYTYEYFHPYDYVSGKCELTEYTYGIHHFNGGWLDSSTLNSNYLTASAFEEMLGSAEQLSAIN